MKEETKKKAVLTGVGLSNGSISAATTTAVLNKDDTEVVEPVSMPTPAPELVAMYVIGYLDEHYKAS